MVGDAPPTKEGILAGIAIGIGLAVAGAGLLLVLVVMQVLSISYSHGFEKAMIVVGGTFLLISPVILFTSYAEMGASKAYWNW